LQWEIGFNFHFLQQHHGLLNVVSSKGLMLLSDEMAKEMNIDLREIEHWICNG